jgi:hypothetical protein
VQLFNRLWVEPQILLAANEDDGEAGAEVQDFRNPLSVIQTLANHLTMFGGDSLGMDHTFSWTLSSESGESTEKQIRMTCESGYDRGRRRS